MRVVRVELGPRSYPIYIGKDLLNDARLLSPHLAADQVMWVSNETVYKLFSARVESLSSAFRQSDQLVLPDGEHYKNLSTLNRIFDQLLSKKHNRLTTLIALGGGVVGDMTGFAAACYQRGVAFIQIPTTLLSQVDSSVGGKTGVNHALGKNMIGAFHQPQCVIIDTGVLDSLPVKELAAGMAEVIKYGLIADRDFFLWLEKNGSALMRRDSEALAYAVERSCQIKAKIVAQDEKESGVRAILNFGHTFGHAIEAHMGYGTWLHGEAVAAGMVMACVLSNKLGWLEEDITKRVIELLASLGLPIAPPKNMQPEDFMKYISVDKKVLDGGLRFVLLKSCGEAVVTDKFDAKALEGTLSFSWG